MQTITHHGIVHQVNNFLSADEITELMQIISEAPTDKQSWTLKSEERDEPDQHSFWDGKIYRAGHLKILENIYDRVSSLFNFCATTTVNGITDLQRTLPEDTPMDVHNDVSGWHKIKYGVVVYINDDYDGGEIHYPDYDLTIKPIAGMVAVHPGDLDHGVKPVAVNPRYILTSFINCDHIDEPCSLRFKTS